MPAYSVPAYFMEARRVKERLMLTSPFAGAFKQFNILEVIEMPNYKVFNDPSHPLNSAVLGQDSDGSWQMTRSNNNNSLVGTDQTKLYTKMGEFYNITFTRR